MQRDPSRYRERSRRYTGQPINRSANQAMSPEIFYFNARKISRCWLFNLRFLENIERNLDVFWVLPSGVFSIDKFSCFCKVDPAAFRCYSFMNKAMAARAKQCHVCDSSGALLS